MVTAGEALTGDTEDFMEVDITAAGIMAADITHQAHHAPTADRVFRLAVTALVTAGRVMVHAYLQAAV